MRYIIITIIFSCLFSAGCSPEAKYKMLSFWIDGVPNPADGLRDEGNGGSKGGQQEKKLEVYIHGPYGARLCSACHESGFSNKLLYPKEELCFYCHKLDMSAKYVHGPLAGGGCLICHDPHNSQFKHLLVAKAEEFCFYCHDQTSVLSGRSHEDAMQKGCTTCHDAHMSDRQYMLKKGVNFIDTSGPEGQTREG